MSLFPYSKESEGIITKCCKALMNRRKEFVKVGNKGRANNCMLVNNSVYGALACQGYASYSPMTTSATTA